MKPAFLTLCPLFLMLAQPVPNSCGSRQLPFAAIEITHPIDSSCGLPGKTSSPTNSQVQNRVKNNLCATGTPNVVTPQMLIDLQGRTPIQGGSGREPANRSALQKLGEGSLVVMKAFIIEAHHADLGTGESVNCNLPDAEGNDVHIALGPTAATQECGSVTAEIIPHFRPDSWAQIGDFENCSNSGRCVVNPAVAAKLQSVAFRITGQLFFDASHEPCPCGKTCSPSRSSLWEIHPVYNIEVCKPGAACNERVNTDWLPFDSWWQSLHNSRPPHTHPTGEKN
jgi:hypothetical protein